MILVRTLSDSGTLWIEKWTFESIKCGVVLDCLNDHHFLKMDLDPRKCFVAAVFVVSVVIIQQPWRHLLAVSVPQQMVVKTSVTNKGHVH
jgi:hypothetical protein